MLLAFAALRSKVETFYNTMTDHTLSNFFFFLQSNVQQETIDRLYAEVPLPVTNWIGPSWVEGKRWQHIMELSKSIEKYVFDKCFISIFPTTLSFSTCVQFESTAFSHGEQSSRMAKLYSSLKPIWKSSITMG